MSHIFLSYARADGVYVRGLAGWLELGGVGVWLDDQVPTSHRWERVLIEQIKTCQALLLVMTPEAGCSKWVAKEVDLARSMGKPIHPLLLRGQIIFALEDVQYEDVGHGGLPSPAFRERLRGIAPRRRLVTHQFGLIPSEAGFFQRRAVSLGPEPGIQVLTGLGGVGKTQLAADLARRLRDSGTLDILLWINVTSREAVVTA